jgi:hypothetical protein
MRFDLVTHRFALPRRGREPAGSFARVAGESSGGEPFRAPPPGVAASSDSDWLDETDRAVGHGRVDSGAEVTLITVVLSTAMGRPARPTAT